MQYVIYFLILWAVCSFISLIYREFFTGHFPVIDAFLFPSKKRSEDKEE